MMGCGNKVKTREVRLVKIQQLKFIMVHPRITFHELTKKVYRSTKIDSIILKLELCFKHYEKVKVGLT